MSPQRITQRHDAAYRRRELDLTELSERVPQREPATAKNCAKSGVGDSREQTGICDNPEHLRTNAETLLIALRRTNRRKCRSGVIAACILFAAFAWIVFAWLTRHFLFRDDYLTPRANANDRAAVLRDYVEYFISTVGDA